MRHTLPISICLLICLCLPLSLSFAQEGGLTADYIKSLQTGLVLDPGTRALMNAITGTDIKQLALNREIVNRYNDVFSLKLKTEGITDQKSSGRCWLFAGYNILRPAVMRKFNLAAFEFSQNHTMFWDKLEKANFFLETIIATAKKDFDDREIQALLTDPVPDGGWWNYYVSIIEKYGCVPKEIMPETINSEKTDRMNKILNNLVCKAAAELRAQVAQGRRPAEVRQYKESVLKDVYRLLVLHLGNPPREFTWRYKDKDEKVIEKTYTPQSFYKDAIAVNLQEYVTLVDHPEQPYNKHYDIHYCRNLIEARDMNFINLSAERLKEFAFTMLQDSLPVWFAADVQYNMDRDKGLMANDLFDYQTLFNLKLQMPKKERYLYKISNPGHAMALIGVDIKERKPQKWLVENSWGKDIGKGGYWTMNDDWFNEYVFTVIVPQKYLPADILNLLKTRPETLPAWDGMRSVFN